MSVTFPESSLGTHHFVGFVMLWLKLNVVSDKLLYPGIYSGILVFVLPFVSSYVRSLFVHS